jgi:cob(I)alamin adenosyltransferase
MSSNHRGDGGVTQLGSGQRVRKDDLRVECVGGIDELSSFLGLARAALESDGPIEAAVVMAKMLLRVQRELHALGAEVARRDEDAAASGGITAAHVAALDREIEDINARLPKLRAFILPGGGVAAAHLHVARAVCRRVERQAVRLVVVETMGNYVVPYLNRLSLVLFSMARWSAAALGSGDVLAKDRQADI